MKHFLALIASMALLVLLASCGGMAETPGEPAAPTTSESHTIETTMKEHTTHANPIAKPFTKDDIAAIEAKFKTIGEYVKAIPAVCYTIESWENVGGGGTIGFYDHDPSTKSNATSPLLTLYTSSPAAEIWTEDPLYALPEDLLNAGSTKIHFLDFRAVPTMAPRGLTIGGNAQKIFDAYPDYRLDDEDGHTLYDITAIYPWAKPEWGQWDGEGSPKYGGPMGGRIFPDTETEPSRHAYLAQFIYADPPMDWDNREDDYSWVNMYDYRWVLTYYIEENIIQGIEFHLLYHPN